ncbi:feruloyl esterase B [Colletotrichum orchidophilum]|uniref:Carboxylic ester hydrolase n=1 Tax=Colletotrichum orchidophilum TaxID=1209926 RepID=A0A1G4BEZ9_9PEZI|nr:feruloyl esterase B [Colletotrichum orchidophilum]OHE99938.1 feruloyl esterase B [Colletotrichum orchidophilum]
MKWTASLTLALAALRQVDATNSTSCTPRLISYWIRANASIATVESVDAGNGFSEEGNLAFPGNVTNLPSLCAVSFIGKTAEGNEYKFAMFLPDDWNNKILTVGNDGFSGGVNAPAMAVGVKYGFVTLSTDAGHNSTANNLTWALNNTDAKLDYGHRALHDSIALTQIVVDKYYGLSAKASYFSGTSDGGRQGLKAAELYPRDFSALLIGAPAWWQSHLQSWRIALGIANLPTDDAKHITADKFTVIGDAVKKQCDAVDGVEDGIVSDPANCTVNFDLFTCGKDGVDATACLSAEQITVAQALYADYKVNDETVFPGVNPSSEYGWDSLLGGGNGSEPNDVAVSYMKYFLFDDEEWAWSSYNDTVPAYANATNPGDLDVNTFNLTKFSSLGGKIIMYHGLSDADVPSKASQVYYDKVVAQSGGDVDAVRAWFRLFFLPGLGHKNTTVDAPWYIAGPGQAEQLGSGGNYSVPGYSDATHDALLALQQWVEGGAGPDSLIATTWKNATDPTTDVLRQRPICPYPSTQKFTSGGDETKPDSFTC